MHNVMLQDYGNHISNCYIFHKLKKEYHLFILREKDKYDSTLKKYN